MFQANPAFYDIRGALAALPEMNWMTAQYASEISLGDAVYLWESGREGGVLAVERSLPTPIQCLIRRASASFAIRRGSKARRPECGFASTTY